MPLLDCHSDPGYHVKERHLCHQDHDRVGWIFCIHVGEVIRRERFHFDIFALDVMCGRVLNLVW